MAKVFSHCPADKFEGDDGCAGCPALPGTEHCEAVFIDMPEREHFDPEVAEAFNRRVKARAAAGDPVALALIAAFSTTQE